MPELPEVQTIVTQLKESLVGKKITSVDVNLPKIFSGDKKALLGLKIVDVKRRAKMIIIDLEGPLSIIIHLKMTGQLIFAGDGVVSFPNPIPFVGNTLPGKTTHVVFHLNQGTLFFNDMRQFGWVKIINDEDLEKIDIKHGPEPFGKDFTKEYLEKVCLASNRPIKLVLLDQEKIAGIGNIYANEILWCAQINPMAKAKTIKNIDELYKCIKEILEKGIKYGGSSASDEAFVNAQGEKGHMQEHFVVYQKDGSKCPRCGGIIKRETLGGRGTFFCPGCQNSV